MTETSGAELRDTRRDLGVVFELERPIESDCPLSGLSGDIEEIRQQLVDDECHTDLTVRTDDCSCSTDRECLEVRHAAGEIGESCPCTVFSEFGCVPEIAGVRDGSLRIETYLPDRDRLADLVAALKEVSDGLRLRQLRPVGTGAAERSSEVVTVDLYDLTEKQREAITRAVAEGYYETPRETSVGELAREFGISSSALSQRLKAAESKLATAAFAQGTGDD